MSIVDDFDDKTQKRLYDYQGLVNNGERSEWCYYNHSTNMVSEAIAALRVAKALQHWEDQLGELLVDLHVETVPPWCHIDSPGDFWAHTHRWRWSGGGQAGTGETAV